MFILHNSCTNCGNVAQGTHSSPPIQFHSKMTGFLLWNILISKPASSSQNTTKLNELSVLVEEGISLGTTFKIPCWGC